VPIYTVQQGDCFNSIAFEKGFFWEALWDLPENADLKSRRKNPNALLPGDEVFIPDKEPKQVACATGKRHVFRRKGVPSRLDLVLLDSKHQQRSGVPYTLEVEGQRFEGTTADDGKISQTIPPNAREGTLTLRPAGQAEEAYRLKLGHLNPLDHPSGIQSRLGNLGYYRGQITGEMDEATRWALSAFQQSAGIEATGEADAATQAALAERYGG